MNDTGWLLRASKTIGLILALGVSVSAEASLFGGSKGWKEEVLLHDGRKIVVERHFNLGPPSLESTERKELDETVTFTPPGTSKKITWKTSFDDFSPELNSLGILLLDIVNGMPYIATSPAGCIAYNKWQRPNPPYITFKFDHGNWERIPLDQFPAELIHANLMSTPATATLKSYYTLEQAKEQMEGRNIALEATTIYRAPIKTWLATCPNLVPIKGGGGWETPGGYGFNIPAQPPHPNIKK